METTSRMMPADRANAALVEGMTSAYSGNFSTIAERFTMAAIDTMATTKPSSNNKMLTVYMMHFDLSTMMTTGKVKEGVTLHTNNINTKT
mmetsp:Transcript_67547/g.119388  ORF Transcript_67547/g.119388 Transcript_67547/m.119388 type:complete len:90 (+) Transcript_67547:698-967(+)